VNGFVAADAWTNGLPPHPGNATWMVVQMPPDMGYERHQTPTLDFDTVLGGSIVLTLDDGEHALEPGDCVVIAGIDHAWHAGANGCSLAVLMLGAVNGD
jgi:quercetin dioxygenase-like cupin family protein